MNLRQSNDYGSRKSREGKALNLMKKPSKLSKEWHCNFEGFKGTDCPMRFDLPIILLIIIIIIITTTERRLPGGTGGHDKQC